MSGLTASLLVLTLTGRVDNKHNVKARASHIFDNLANHPNAGVGVFTSAEKLIVYPEFQYLADTPACKGTCAGACRHTCSFDGRKYENEPGAASTRAVVSEDNVLCTANDPYYRTNNILVHEFAHTLKMIGLNDSEKAQLTRAYNNAKRMKLWRMDSYSMSDEDEYFAEGTGAFFLVNPQSTKKAGGMTECPTKECRTQEEVRSFIKNRDPQLYDILSLVYFKGKPVLRTGSRSVQMSRPAVGLRVLSNKTNMRSLQFRTSI
ncbi:uncharacterized protein LOC112557709 [Pomacea canaliculata]|uniref:uncharacterized protein LOC112557709 n=1 Tax=Pomacea canaliculata TaxID=400727 RepID=UPI000D730A77|nr:uncharacterized protein LOC112557709 [Pomacea canaliculata]